MVVVREILDSVITGTTALDYSSLMVTRGRVKIKC